MAENDCELILYFVRQNIRLIGTVMLSIMMFMMVMMLMMMVLMMIAVAVVLAVIMFFSVLSMFLCPWSYWYKFIVESFRYMSP